MRFKVGDTATVNTDRASSSKLLKGDRVVIKSVYDKQDQYLVVNSEGGSWWEIDRHLDPIVEVTKYKRGDKVVIRASRPTGANLHIGDVVTIDGRNKRDLKSWDVKDRNGALWYGIIESNLNPIVEESKYEDSPKPPITMFEQVGTEIGKLVSEKNKAYGDSFSKFGEFLELLWPDGVPVSAYSDMLTIVRIFDKFMRIVTDKDALGESP